MRIWKEVSVQVFEFIFVLAYFITSEIFKSPVHFFTTEFITCLLCYRSFIQNTSLFLWPSHS